MRLFIPIHEPYDAFPTFFFLQSSFPLGMKRNLSFSYRNANNYPTLSFEHQGIARRLLRAALNEAARKREMRYKDLQKIGKGIRRFFHDDITVVVVYIDHDLRCKNVTVPELSIKGFIDTVGPSNFRNLRGLE